MLAVYANIDGKRIHGKALDAHDGQVLVLADDGTTHWCPASSIEATGGGSGGD